MKQLNRVVITGLGAVSPLGLSAPLSWQALLNNESGIISTSEYVNRLKAEDPSNKLAMPEYYPLESYVAPIKQGFDHKKWKVAFSTNNTNSYAMAAAHEALTDSGLMEILQASEDLQVQTGVNVGVMSSNIPKLTEILRDSQTKGFSALNRLTILQVLTNMASANISIKYNLKGEQEK